MRKTQQESTVASRAHDWAQTFPIRRGYLTCMRCGAETKIGNWSIPRCHEHLEFSRSGFKNEAEIVESSS